jgi:hypothetical protein
MRNGKSSTDLQLNVPTYLPLSEAADRYNLSENILTQLIQAGKIEAVRLPSGEVLVPADNGTHIITKEQIIEEDFAALRGQLITVSEAAEKYDIPRSTIQSWIYRSNYLEPVGDNYPLVVDEAEVAYCVNIYKQRRATGSKAPLLDENGLPYELKHPDLAAYRRQKRKVSNH